MTRLNKVTRLNVNKKVGSASEETVQAYNSTRNKLLKGIENSKLRNLVADLYRKRKHSNEIIGDGSLIDALRYEVKTEKSVGSTSHKIKMEQFRKDGGRFERKPLSLILKEEVMPLLLKVSPSFRSIWKEHLNYWKDEPRGLYIDLAEYARHIVDLYRKGKIKEFPDIFDVIERLHVEGDDYVKEAVTVGLLEDIQNNALAHDIDLDTFLSYLGPVSNEYWKKVIKFWEKGEEIV